MSLVIMMREYTEGGRAALTEINRCEREEARRDRRPAVRFAPAISR
ncbi:hypothetical protein P2H44_04295 [Albimonas sp. CAU 1670]|nr:hypothetical protein [Albimonas sp. CAU 1670]MDF2231764.1 hypothetical protein [Albimonas sp. CAU 1670]